MKKKIFAGLFALLSFAVFNVQVQAEEEKNYPAKKSASVTSDVRKPHLSSFKMYRFYDSDVYVYTTGTNETLTVSMGSSKREKLKDMKMANETAKINLGMFGEGFQHAGMYLLNGKYIQQPSDKYINLHVYKDGRVDIMNYDRRKLGLSTIKKLQQETNFVVGTTYSLVQDGVKNLENAFSFSNSTERHPRSLFGQLKDGRYVLVAVDGRRSKSLGVNASRSADIMLKLGAVEAVNLDGGGSSSLIVGGKIKNKPSDSRSIGSALFVVKKNEASQLKNIKKR